MRMTGLVLVLLLVVTTVSAAETGVDYDAGLVKADSPLYGVDVAMDEFRGSVIPEHRGAAAFERSSEMYVAEKRNNTAAFEKAMTAFADTVETADNRSIDGLQKAESVLLAVENRTPEEAQEGVQQALSRVREAQERKPQTVRGDLGEKPDVGGNFLTRLDNQSGRDDGRVPERRGR